MLKFILPVQFPLHEPYFDLTPIKVIHTKIETIYIYTLLYILTYRITKLIALLLSALDELLVPN